MDPNAVNLWHIELTGAEEVARSVLEVAEILKTAELQNIGRMTISYDDGPRPWWHRLLGTARRYVSGFVTIEWADEYASLIFLDENWSEYRTLDQAHPVSPPVEIRAKISHEEPKPQASEECMHKARAFAAVREALQSGDRPAWLSFRFVK